MAKKTSSRKTGNQPSPTDGPVFIALDGHKAVPAGARAMLDDNSTPTRSFVKGVIRDGRFVHPKTGALIEVTPERRKHWADTIGQMLSNGVDIEVLANHGQPGKRAEYIRGYVRDAFNDGEWLNLNVEMRGEDGIKLAETVNNVSIEIEHDFTDGNANKYQDCITAVAICEKPVITAQQGFKRIAASAVESDDDAPVYQLKLSTDDNNMDANLLSFLGTMIGKTDLTEANALSELTAWDTKRKSDATAQATKLSNLEGQIKRLGADDNDPLKLSAVDGDSVELMAEGIEAKRDALVSKGKISPAVATELSTLLIGKPGERNVLCLSGTVAKRAGQNAPLAKAVFAALEKNEVARLGQRTTVQTMSRIENGGDDFEKESTEAIERMKDKTPDAKAA